MNTIKLILASAQTSEIKCREPFLGGGDIAEDLQDKNFVKKVSRTSCIRHMCMAELLLRCAVALRYMKQKAAPVFRLTYFQDLVQLTFIETGGAALLRLVVCRYLTLVTTPEKKVPACSFYAAEICTLSVSRVPLAKMKNGHASKCDDRFSQAVFNTGILLLSGPFPTLQNVLVNKMNRF